MVPGRFTQRVLGVWRGTRRDDTGANRVASVLPASHSPRDSRRVGNAGHRKQMSVRVAMRAFAVLALSASMIPFSPTSKSALAVTQKASASPCGNYQLLIHRVRSSGAAGHLGRMYRIHNFLAHPCTLRGYPGLVLLDRNFFSLPTHVTRGLAFLPGKNAPVTVTLSGNHDAYFVLEWARVPSPGQSCPNAPYMLLTPPNDHLPVAAYAGIDACGGNMTTSPVAPNAFNF